MALSPQKFREIVFQILYSQGYETSNGEDTALMLMAELKVNKKSVLEALRRARAVEDLFSTIDPWIEKSSSGYSFERISGVEKMILRLALFEMRFDSEIPEKVALAEAIRLTRKFGTPESANFVNAILDDALKASVNRNID